MISIPLLNFPPLKEGVLLKRYKRFFADIELDSGEVVTAHCANTGPMKGILHPGGKVRLRFSPSPKRKLAWTWEQAEVIGVHGNPCWVGINTSLPNKLVKLAIEAGLLKDDLGEHFDIQSEIPYGKNLRSRIDLLLSPNLVNCNYGQDSRKIFLEVKSTTWTEGTIALFPDTVTKRGQKHLIELIGVIPQSRAVLVPCISRSDALSFSTGDKADPIYGQLFREAKKEGVEIIPCSFGFHLDKVTWEGKRPLEIT